MPARNHSAHGQSLMSSQSTLAIPGRTGVRCGRLSRPGQVEQHHDPLGWKDPVGQQPASGTKAHHPASIAKAAPAKDHEGLGRIHPKDRQHASDRAGHQRRGAAELLVDLLGDQDPVGGSRLSSCALLPGRQLGAITLADALTSACQAASCSAEGVGGSLGIGIASLMRPPYDRPS
jgi:hypothetical protein